ncbi:MAG: pilus assembly protein [Pseudomonadota bacterium]
MRHPFLRGWRKDESANVAVMFVIVAVPLLMAVGAAIDSSRIVSAERHMQAALDAATLAGARALEDELMTAGDIKPIVEDVFFANLETSFADLACEAPQITVDKTNDLVSVDANCAFDAVFGTSLARTGTLSVGAGASAKTDLAEIELILALDLSKSMIGPREVAQRESAHALVAHMMSLESRKIRIGIAPFGYSINAGIYGEWAKGFSTLIDDTKAGMTKSCVTERRDDLEITDTLPMPGAWLGNLTERCPDVAIRPLTNVWADLTSTINDMSAHPDALTAGHLGVVWAWYMLSPSWNSVWPDGSDAGAYDDARVEKVLVLVTDGTFQVGYGKLFGHPGFRAEYGAYHWPGPNAVELCEEMHDDGITIYSIGLDIPGPTSGSNPRQNLVDCASSDDHFYEIESESELIGVFEEIASSVTGPIIIG